MVRVTLDNWIPGDNVGATESGKQEGGGKFGPIVIEVIGSILTC